MACGPFCQSTCLAIRVEDLYQRETLVKLNPEPIYSLSSYSSPLIPHSPISLPSQSIPVVSCIGKTLASYS